MTAHIVRFLGLLLMSLLAGTMFGLWLGFDPSGLSARTYVEQQEHAMRAGGWWLAAVGCRLSAVDHPPHV